jgi:hypothetical protein
MYGQKSHTKDEMTTLDRQRKTMRKPESRQGELYTVAKKLK